MAPPYRGNRGKFEKQRRKQKAKRQGNREHSGGETGDEKRLTFGKFTEFVKGRVKACNDTAISYELRFEV